MIQGTDLCPLCSWSLDGFCVAAIETLTSADINSKVLEAREPVLVDLYQANCPPCRALEPRLARIAQEHLRQVGVYRVDIDRDLLLAERFHVKSLPTILLVHQGQEIERLDGLITDEALKALFDRTKAWST